MLSLVGLALILLEGLATKAPVFLVLLCWTIPLAVVLEVMALVYGIVAAQARSGKVAVGIALLSLGLFGVLVIPWFWTGPHTIGP
jgi:hypothetical protein